MLRASQSSTFYLAASADVTWHQRLHLPLYRFLPQQQRRGINHRYDDCGGCCARRELTRIPSSNYRNVSIRRGCRCGIVQKTHKPLSWSHGI